MPETEPDGRLDTATRPSPPRRGTHPAVDGSRPFGAHLRMSWWKPVVLLVVPPLVVVLSQILLHPVVDAIEGNDPLAPVLTPLRLLAVNLTVVASALLAILLLARMTGAPWHSLLSPSRAFDTRRLAQYLVGAALLVGPRSASWRSSRPTPSAGPPSGSPARPSPSWRSSC